MLRIAICDDNIQELEKTAGLISSFAEIKTERDFYIRRFQSSYDLFECVNTGIAFSVYILDIIMPVMNGIDVGAKIREKDENAIIIYLTSSMDYAIKSYNVYAFQYLLKPIEKAELFSVLEKAIDKIAFETIQSFPVKTKQGISAIRFHKIMFVEYSNHTMSFHLSDETVVTSVIMREPFSLLLEDILQDYRFVRCHSAFVVNLNFVSDILQKNFIIKNNRTIPISKNIQIEVKKRYIDFLLKGEQK